VENYLNNANKFRRKISGKSFVKKSRNSGNTKIVRNCNHYVQSVQCVLIVLHSKEYTYLLILNHQVAAYFLQMVSSYDAFTAEFS